MPQGIIKRFPDTSGCNHVNIAVRRGDVHFEYGYCPDCKFAIAFRLDKDGKRTGDAEIVELATLPDDESKH
jgi:hypothetical protein